MADENILPRDQNHVTAAGFENSLAAGDVRPGQIIVATGRIKVDNAGGGSGDVSGPGSSTDNAVVRWDGATGTQVQNSVVIITDLGAVSGVTTLAVSGLIQSATGIAVEETGAGTDIITIQAPASIAASYTLTLPVDDGTSNQVLTTDGSGVLSWTTPATGTVTSVSGTANRITSTGGATPVIDISAAYVGQTSITTLGTVTTGTLSTGVVIAGVTMTLGSDATGDIYYRNSSGVLTRLGIGSTANVLTVAGGLPSWAAPAASSLVVGSTAIASGTSTRILYDNAGVLGEYTLTGSGTVVVMQTSPSLITPALGVATATSVNGLIITTTTGTLTVTNGKTLAVSDSTTLATNAITLGGGEVITFSASNALSLLTTGTTVMTFPQTTDTVVTLAASQTLTNKTLTSPVIQTAPVLAAATNLKYTVPSSDVTATGDITNEFNSGYSSTAIGDLVYLDTSATWQKADADASAATYSSMLGIALSVTASGAAATVLLRGFVYAATPFPTFTIGAPIYMSATAGAVTQTAPVTTDSATRLVGYAVHADKMWFCPSNDWITHT